MAVPLKEIITAVKTSAGVRRKAVLGHVFAELVTKSAHGAALPNYGDDAAILPHGEGFILFSTDAIMAELVNENPRLAGRAAITACVNDIYSMGGRPWAVVDVLACGDDNTAKETISGLKEASEQFRVPIVGGHTDPDAASPAISVSILGFGRKLLRCHLAKDGQELVAAFDLDGKFTKKSVPVWNSNFNKRPEVLVRRLEVFPRIAESALACCCKDVSNAGLLGTASIMMENSAAGAIIDLDRIPIPLGVDLVDWLLCFQSYGFILGVDPGHTHEVIDLFKREKVTAAVIGRVTGERKVVIRSGDDEVTAFDFNREHITGIMRPDDR